MQPEISHAIRPPPPPNPFSGPSEGEGSLAGPDAQSHAGGRGTILTKDSAHHASSGVRQGHGCILPQPALSAGLGPSVSKRPPRCSALFPPRAPSAR
ncbi:uncharacterized protein VTP21DRAFT_2692 [Calcarisporiella thermophila]|uniref:uncharacterized protein n=1 Tax=Calcarisporiella thermophila TaxID=911321 RepID=UPI0037446C15